MQPIHERLPVILEKEELAARIAPATKLETALAPLKPCSSEKMVAYPVSSSVNSARHDGPDLVARVDETVPDQF